MQTVKTLVMIVRLCWVIALVIGLLLWSGKEISLAVHALPGAIVAFSLLFLGVKGFRVAAAPAAVAVVVALLLPVLGIMQLGSLAATTGALLPALHVVLALASIGLAEVLGKKLRTA